MNRKKRRIEHYSKGRMLEFSCWSYKFVDEIIYSSITNRGSISLVTISNGLTATINGSNGFNYYKIYRSKCNPIDQVSQGHKAIILSMAGWHVPAGELSCLGLIHLIFYRVFRFNCVCERERDLSVWMAHEVIFSLRLLSIFQYHLNLHFRPHKYIFYVILFGSYIHKLFVILLRNKCALLTRSRFLYLLICTFLFCWVFINWFVFFFIFVTALAAVVVVVVVGCC